MGGVHEVDKTSGGTVTKTTVYYPVAGAMRINGTLYYNLTDHLGSASVVTDLSGVTVGEQRYYAYGETRFSTGSMFTDQLYTGQREMAGLGIYHYGARFYSPKLGRFLSADTIIPSYANPQSLNRFAYTLNNPMRYTDPTGHTAVCPYGPEDCAALEDSNSDNSNNNSNNNTNNNNNNDDECPDWNACVTDVNASTMQSYWDSNNVFLNIMGITGIVEAAGGLAGMALGGVTLISPASIALLTGIAVADPEPISKILIGAGAAALIVGAIAVTAAYDIQNVNNAIVKSGAYNNGGSITAGPLNVNITTSNTTTTVHTHIPFAAAASLWLWAHGNSQLVPGY